jgi:hypothetical protein
MRVCNRPARDAADDDAEHREYPDGPDGANEGVLPAGHRARINPAAG